MRNWKPLLWIAAGLAAVWFLFMRKPAATAGTRPGTSALQLPGGGSVNVPDRLIPGDVVQAANGALRVAQTGSTGQGSNTAQTVVAGVNAGTGLLQTLGRWLGWGTSSTSSPAQPGTPAFNAAVARSGADLSRYDPLTGTSYIGDLWDAPEWVDPGMAQWGVTGWNASLTDQVLLDNSLTSTIVPDNYVTDWYSLGFTPVAETPAMYWGDDWGGF